MRIDPFIEAEEAAGHSVKRSVSAPGLPCRLLPAPTGRPLGPGRHRRRADRADHRHPHRVQGHLWVPEGAPGPCANGVSAVASAGWAGSCARLVWKDAAKSGGVRPRWPIPTPTKPSTSSSATSDPGPRSTAATWATSPTSPLGRGGPTWPRSSTSQSRRVVGWALADHMRTELVSDALTMAFRNRSPEEGLIFHSDRGCQYTSADYGKLTRDNGVVLSVGRKGECWDNAVAESFFATIKRELIDTRAWPTRQGLRRAVFDYIEGWYNVRRLHSSLDYCSPAEWEAIHHDADRQAA